VPRGVGSKLPAGELKFQVIRTGTDQLDIKLLHFDPQFSQSISRTQLFLLEVGNRLFVSFLRVRDSYRFCTHGVGVIFVWD
jgi:hypothetical protein